MRLAEFQDSQIIVKKKMKKQNKQARNQDKTTLCKALFSKVESVGIFFDKVIKLIDVFQSCTTGVCPIVLTLHGTTISPQNQADSYKHMVNEKFQFGFPLAWTLAPTRFHSLCFFLLFLVVFF